jgi:hypothetical protein
MGISIKLILILVNKFPLLMAVLIRLMFVWFKFYLSCLSDYKHRVANCFRFREDAVSKMVDLVSVPSISMRTSAYGRN